MTRSLDPAGAENALIRAALDGDDARADEILERVPEVRRDSLACALLVAEPGAADRLNSASVNTAVDPTGWPPRLLLCSSRYRTGDAAVAAARLDLASRLLELGADPNAGTREAETVRGYRTVLGAATGRARSAALVRMLAGGRGRSCRRPDALRGLCDVGGGAPPRPRQPGRAAGRGSAAVARLPRPAPEPAVRRHSRAAPTSACGTPSTTTRRPAGLKPAGTRTSQSASPLGPGRSDGRYWTRTSDP